MAAPVKTLFYDGFWKNNPIFVQVLGICSTLAVTNLLANTLFMCAGLIFSTAMSSLTISLLRKQIPARIRMIVQVLIIATFVMMVDIIIKATAPEIHRFIGPYVGLIITNCIIMGRAEAFAMQNKPIASFIDGIAMGLGYSAVLIIIALVREPLGFGTILGYKLPALQIWWHQWTIMVMAPGAFFMLGLLSWFARMCQLPKEKR
ncbi:MAG: electron transport complex subunit RsxE [Chitinispirillaceae bacterium]|nr:electron transport complex subunit RsxE [Chitinispirillaceae bacterium]